MALIISQGDYTIFFTHPISLAFLVIAVLSFTIPLIRSARKEKPVAECKADTGS
jgi:putative tricarboxylic transport membrane protein